MKLYYSPGACSLSPHIVLREAGIPFTLVRVDLKTHAVSSGGTLAAITPKDYVPVLEFDDGERLTEGPVIVQYIADLRPSAELIPAPGTLQRYRVLEWLNYTTSELHKSFSPLFHTELPVDDWRAVARQKLASAFAWLNAELSGRTHIAGERFSVADAYLFTVVNWTRFVGYDLQPWPALRAYLDRVASRPKVQEALQAEGLIRQAA